MRYSILFFALKLRILEISESSKTLSCFFSSGSLVNLKGFPLENVWGANPLCFSQDRKALNALMEILQVVVLSPWVRISTTNEERFCSEGICPTYLIHLLKTS